MCKLKSYKEIKERILRMTIVKHDSVDISPSDFQPETQTAETQDAYLDDGEDNECEHQIEPATEGLDAAGPQTSDAAGPQTSQDEDHPSQFLKDQADIDIGTTDPNQRSSQTHRGTLTTETPQVL